jgi:23S rRNA (uracil1939-C5)-methyltransferase
MLRAGQSIELTIEKPAAGGRMIARHDGQVLLVGGAVPGERVLARVERVDRRLAFATVDAVLQPSPDRRDSFTDPLCGGCVYSHVAYPRQLELKAEIVRDAFLRLGRIPIAAPIPVAASPERGYRMRARFHVSGGRVGFYREGTHTLCDARATGQLSSDAVDAVRDAVAAVERDGSRAISIELSENIAGSERALSIELEQGRRVSVGAASVADSIDALTAGRVLSSRELRRQPESFFQANRYLLPSLVMSVVDLVPGDGHVLDLYAGVGLFSLTLAATGRENVIAVEGDRASGTDLERNAIAFASAVTVAHDSVESYLATTRTRPATVILDPPRTGVSADATSALVRLAAPRIVYVSCDPATMARDARRLLDSGYRLETLTAFDLFPNTAHVESLGLFVKCVDGGDGDSGEDR